MMSPMHSCSGSQSPGHKHLARTDWPCLSAAGLHTHVVLDSGRTNANPNTRSVLVLGPADANLVDPITSSLKLLS